MASILSAAVIASPEASFATAIAISSMDSLNTPATLANSSASIWASLPPITVWISSMEVKAPSPAPATAPKGLPPETAKPIPAIESILAPAWTPACVCWLAPVPAANPLAAMFNTMEAIIILSAVMLNFLAELNPNFAVLSAILWFAAVLRFEPIIPPDMKLGTKPLAAPWDLGLIPEALDLLIPCPRPPGSCIVL